MEQWKVTYGKFKRTFSKFMGAKREYGMICKEVEEEQSGLVQMWYREDLSDDWKCIEEFGYDEDEEEEEEPEEDDDDDED
jgi:hypothetical protein